jgi:uncharacterized protein YndB with AHSA1/START domain
MDTRVNNRDTATAEREVVISRLISAPRALVWQAMTEPEHQNRWWGPDGFSNEEVTMDFRLGGAWTFVMVGPDGTRYPNHAVFKEITPPSRWVFDHGDGQRVWFESTITLDETADRLRYGSCSPARHRVTKWSTNTARSRAASSTWRNWKNTSGRTCVE